MIILDEYRLRVVQQKKDIEELGRALNIEPVSYTHLDVYKRQVPARFQESARTAFGVC